MSACQIIGLPGCPRARMELIGFIASSGVGFSLAIDLRAIRNTCGGPPHHSIAGPSGELYLDRLSTPSVLVSATHWLRLYADVDTAAPSAVVYSIQPNCAVLSRTPPTFMIVVIVTPLSDQPWHRRPRWCCLHAHLRCSPVGSQ